MELLGLLLLWPPFGDAEAEAVNDGEVLRVARRATALPVAERGQVMAAIARRQTREAAAR